MKKTILFLLALVCTQLQSANTGPSSQTLHLSYRNLSSIELDSAKASNLVEIDVSGNPIKKLPASLAYAKDLKIVKLNSCKNLEWLPLIALLKKLQVEELEMDFCNLTYIPLELRELKHLRKISMRNNELSDIPWNLFLNANLESLNFAYNQITEIGKEISYPKQLRFLDLSDNPCINTSLFWKQLPELQSLEVLSINGCEKIPAVATLPPLLKELHMDDCKATLPKAIGNTGNLRVISLENYALNTNDAADALSPYTGPAKELHFSSMYISKLDNSLLGFPQLEFLSLECGQLGEVCDLSTLKNLRRVAIKSSDTNTVDKILQLLAASGVSELTLQGNTFNILPASISKLKSVKQLNLQNCNISNIFKAVATLDSLQELDLRGCGSLDPVQIVSYQKAHPNTNVYFNTVYLPATTSDPQPTIQADNRYIHKPFPDLHLPEEQFMISNKRDTTLTASDGSKISIPANSMVDANNKLIKEPVKVIYQTYKTPEEVFASGIPMKADSAGQSFDFASAGMFSLNAVQANGKNAFLAKGKEMNIDFTSSYPNKSYNYYYLDTVKKNWVQTGKDKIEEAKRVKPKPKKPEEKKPVSPDKVAYGKIYLHVTSNKPRKERPQFKINYTMGSNLKRADTVLYNPKEIAELKDCYWEYVGQDNKAFFKMVNDFNFFTGLRDISHGWFRKSYLFATDTKESVEFRLDVDRADDCYNFVFSTNTDSIVIPAIPVIHKDDPSKIQKENKEIFNNYSKLYSGNNTYRNVRVTDFTRAYNVYIQKMDLYRRLLDAYKDNKVSYEQYMYLYNNPLDDNIDSLDKQKVNTSTVTRSLALTGFGTYNCDYFTRNENWIVSNPKFIDQQTGNSFRPSNVTLIDLTTNAYIYGAEHDLKLAKNKDYWIFTTDRTGKIGFAAVSTKNSKPEKIAVKEVKAKSIEELRKELNY